MVGKQQQTKKKKKQQSRSGIKLVNVKKTEVNKYSLIKTSTSVTE